MSTGTNSLLERILGWLPAWLGFVLIILAGVLAIVFGAMQSVAGLISIGIWAIAAAIIAWVAGATSTPRVNPFEHSFGGAVSRIPQIPWLIIAALFVVAVVVAIVF